MILRILGLGLLVAGIVFLVLGLNATDTLGEELSKELSGQYSDRTVWYIVGGCVGIVVGGGLALFGGKFSSSAA